MFNSISSCGTLRFASWQRMPLWPWSMFSSIFLSFWPCGPSFPCILALWAFLQFLAFWPCGPSFPCILALWAFISLHFGLAGLHFLSFWPFRGRLLGFPPQVAKNCPFAQRPYNGFISAVTGPILQFLAFWAFISLHFDLVGLHFLAFWPSGPSFRCILALWAFISLHFGLLDLHFVAFWPSGLSFPCILATWPFIFLHFGLVGLHFLAFWPCGPSFPFILAFSGSASGPPPTSCQKWPVCPTSLQWIYQRRDRPHFAVFSILGFHFLAVFSILGLHFLAFWPCGPSFPCILALWAFISLHFGLLGLHFLLFWLSRPLFPFILALWAFISFYFGFMGLHFL